MPTDWNFRNLEHRTEMPLPTVAELRVLEKVLNRCVHRTWTREQDRGGYRTSVCDVCGASLHIGFDRQGADFEPDPVVSDAEVCDMWLKELPRPARMEVMATFVFRVIEKAGWQCLISQNGNRYSCSMSKGSERISSGQQETKSEAIVAAAAQVATGKFPR